MPAPEKNAFAETVTSHFAQIGIVLPLKWCDPGPQFGDAFLPHEKKVAANPPGTLFKEATLNEYHVKAARQIGGQFETYLRGISHAVCDGIEKWMKMVKIISAIINGPVGTVLPGAFNGPPLIPLIMSSAPQKTPQELKYSKAIANAIGTGWNNWYMGLSGTLAYPSFAAFPGPMAPAMPNTPVSLASFSSMGEISLSRETLKNSMAVHLKDPKALHAMALFDAVSVGLDTHFQLFKTTTFITNVMGTGPVPSFAPPVTPAGPVAGGGVIPSIGILN